MTDREAEKPKLIAVGERLYVRQEIDNIGWLDVGDGVVVIDALEQHSLREEIFTLLRRTMDGKPVLRVLNTHTHYDHVALNEDFVREFGAEIVNRQTREIPAGGLEVGSASRSVRLIPLPDCHTREDCVVWVPDAAVLFVGDIFGWGLIPWDRPLDAAKRDHLVRTYERLIAFGAETVVPGHGPLCGNAELRRWLDYFAWLIETIGRAKASGLSLDEVRDGRIAPPEDMGAWWRFRKWKHHDSVKKVSHAIYRNRL